VIKALLLGYWEDSASMVKKGLREEGIEVLLGKLKITIQGGIDRINYGQVRLS
jgi:RecB family exonuclease